MKRLTGISIRAMAASALLAAALVAAGCGGSGPVGPPGQTAAIDGSASGPGVSTSLVGTWRNTFFFIDPVGASNASQTTWQFNADGTAVRTTVTQNFTLGVSDTTFVTARWRATANVVIIDFLSPTPGTIELLYSVQGNQLILAGQTYLRVGG
jgi:ABC-type glycerol-3-phosphate transport system substrate-binding protein